MPHIADEYFMIRTTISHYYKAGSGKFATPKLYRRGDAIRWCNKFNTGYIHPTDGPWEVVPVALVFGAPVPLQQE
mgnify:CR=1 FL=1